MPLLNGPAEDAMTEGEIASAPRPQSPSPSLQAPLREEMVLRRRSEDYFPPTDLSRHAGDDPAPPGGSMHTGPTHWSIGWSDLMMTMCMLFLILYVQQTSQRSFVRESAGEVVAGSEIVVEKPADKPWPLAPITPQISDRPGDLLRRVDPDRPFQNIDAMLMQRKTPTAPAMPPLPRTGVGAEANQPATNPALEELRRELRKPSADRPPEEPFLLSISSTPAPASMAELYDMSTRALDEEGQKQLAQVELVPDQAVRIILTADLLFPSGSNDLSERAKKSLRKLAAVIRDTPHRIHVEGHSDNMPIHSIQYPSNWELSLARAGRVARFLIEDMGIPAARFVVAGHADNHPRQPNSDEVGRAANRRVEILFSGQDTTGPPAHFFDN